MAQLYLPSDALKAILAFMRREQLIELSEVNRQYYSAINSPQFTSKPLLRIEYLRYEWAYNTRRNEARWVWREETKNNKCLRIPDDAIQPLLERAWLRIDSVYIDMPFAHEDDLRRLELLESNPRCLRGARKLVVGIMQNTQISPEIGEIIEKLRPLVQQVSMWRYW